MILGLFLLGIVGVISVFFSVPMVRKPLAEDEGRWYYFAFFVSRGLVLHRDYYCQGYFNIPLISAFFYKLFGSGNPEVFHWLKVGWYALNSMSLFLLTLLLFGDVWAAFGAGTVLAVVQGSPRTMFMLTYAEHYSILPVNIALMASVACIRGSDPVLAAVAGLMAGLCIHFKPTGLLFAAFLSALLLLTPQPWEVQGWYLVVLLTVLALPLALIPRDGMGVKPYLKTTFIEPFRDGILALTSKLGFSSLDGRFGVISEYVGRLHGDETMTGMAKFKANMGFAMKDLRFVLGLAAIGLLFTLGSAPYFALLLVLLVLLFLAVQQLQQNYYTPHFNSIWPFVSVLAGYGGWRLVELGVSWPVLGVGVALVSAWESVRLGGRLVSAFGPSRSSDFGIVHPYIGVLFSLARDIGTFIGSSAQKDDKLLVWGDQPTIYLYSGLMACDPNYLFMYSHNADFTEQRWLFWTMRKTPPEWIQFFNWKYKDGREIEYIQDRIGVRYNLVRSFCPSDENGNKTPNPAREFDEFKLYRRDDTHFISVLAERATAHEALGDYVSSRQCLEQIIKIEPDSAEAKLRLEILDEAGADNFSVVAKQVASRWLRSAQDEEKKRVSAQVMAQVLIRTGRPEGAEALLDDLLESNVSDVQALIAKGRILLDQGRRDQAMVVIQKALTIEPFSPSALAAFGDGIATAGDVEMAAKCYEKALTLMWWHPQAMHGLDTLSGSSVARIELYGQLGVLGYVSAEDLPNTSGMGASVSGDSP